MAGIVLVLAACGGGGAPATGGPSAATSRPAATPGAAAAESCSKEAGGDTVISIESYEFPAETRIAAGTSITWTNNHDTNHTVTFRGGGPDCGMLLIGESTTVQFDTPGEYEYLCKFFFTVMHGKVIVE
jgi:plastocyanin